jgi:hypothetical protein
VQPLTSPLAERCLPAALCLLLVACAAAEPQDERVPTAPTAAATTISAPARRPAGPEPLQGQRVQGNSYADPFVHPGGSDCSCCHRGPDGEQLDPESPDWLPRAATCRPCHSGLAELRQLRGPERADHDGDGEREALADELDGLLSDLLQHIVQASEATGVPICYHAERYPFWMKDLDRDGRCDEEEASPANAYEVWTRPLLNASYNYQAVRQDRGAWAHNFDYAAQLLIDAMAQLDADTSRYQRP